VSEEALERTPPGWYHDPAGSGGWRYFDGSSWTDRIQSRVTNGEAPKLRSNVAPLAERLQRVFLPVAAALVGLDCIVRFQSRELLHTAHAVVEWVRRGDTKAPLPSLNTSAPGWEGVLSQFAVLATLLTLILFLVWQFRSATESEALGYPMKISRRFAVWSWFIPIVNLWVPYRALAELLPPDDERRKFAWYLCGLNAAKLLGVFSLILAILDNSLAWWTAWFIVSFLTSVSTQLLRRQIVLVTEADHVAFVKSLPEKNVT